MKFIELTGKKLSRVINSDEINEDELSAAGVSGDTIVRVNQQGDIEVRRPQGWDLVGGLLGDYDQRLKQATGLDWA
jgi:hypothetical protein